MQLWDYFFEFLFTVVKEKDTDWCVDVMIRAAYLKYLKNSLFWPLSRSTWNSDWRTLVRLVKAKFTDGKVASSECQVQSNSIMDLSVYSPKLQALVLTQKTTWLTNRIVWLMNQNKVHLIATGRHSEMWSMEQRRFVYWMFPYDSVLMP